MLPSQVFDFAVMQVYYCTRQENDFVLNDYMYQKAANDEHTYYKLVKESFTDDPHNYFEKYSDALAERANAGNRLYYQKGFADGIKFIMEALAIGGS